MRGLLARLKGARHAEWIALAAAAAIVILALTGGALSRDGGGATDLEERMERVLACVKGAGRVRVLLNAAEPAYSAFSASGADASEVVEGAVIVAEGADDIRVALELQRAAQAFLGIEIDRIEVFEMGGK